MKEEIKEKKDEGEEKKKDENVNNIGNENEIKENKIKNQGESNETLNIINSINSDNSIPLENNWREAQNNNICNSVSLSLSGERRGDKDVSGSNYTLSVGNFCTCSSGLRNFVTLHLVSQVINELKKGS